MILTVRRDALQIFESEMLKGLLGENPISIISDEEMTGTLRATGDELSCSIGSIGDIDDAIFSLILSCNNYFATAGIIRTVQDIKRHRESHSISLLCDCREECEHGKVNMANLVSSDLWDAFDRAVELYNTCQHSSFEWCASVFEQVDDQMTQSMIKTLSIPSSFHMSD
jgi:hypothetical protein